MIKNPLLPCPKGVDYTDWLRFCNNTIQSIKENYKPCGLTIDQELKLLEIAALCIKREDKGEISDYEQLWPQFIIGTKNLLRKAFLDDLAKKRREE